MQKEKPAKKHASKRKAAWFLVVLAPLIAEISFGSTALHFAYLILLWLPIYGAGILLIREVVRRTGRGWPSIILLGLAYELAEDGLGLQALSSPNLYHAASWAPQIFGLNIAYWEVNIIIHVVFSALIPIFLTDLIFPAYRAVPYLKKTGLIITAIIAILGIAILRFTVPLTLDPTYSEPLFIVIGCLIGITFWAIMALKVMPAKTVTALTENAIPSRRMLGMTGLVGTVVLFGLINPYGGPFVHNYWAFLPMILFIAVAFGLLSVIRRWAKSSQWTDRHTLALASGALIGHSVFGLVAAHLELYDRIGLAVLIAVMIWLLILLDRKVQKNLAVHA
jgi:hypothetical protein